MNATDRNIRGVTIRAPLVARSHGLSLDLSGPSGVCTLNVATTSACGLVEEEDPRDARVFRNVPRIGPEPMSFRWSISLYRERIRKVLRVLTRAMTEEAG